MKFHIFVLLAFIIFCGNLISVSAQADSVIGQFTNANAESFAGGISGVGRFVVFESTGNVATENPRNADGNREIFLFDYAQRRIFQITDTKSLLVNTANPATFQNTKVGISNIRPTISNDGRWIVFGSNANSLTVPLPNVTPGSFDANSLTDAQGNNPLTQDGNMEIWMYQIPQVAPVDLTGGAEIPLTDLSAGTFLRVTDTPASYLPAPGSTTAGPSVADDNREASINDDGSYIAFVSTRDLVAGGNASPDANDEIFTYVRGSNAIKQVTRTTRGTVSAPTYNQSPTISGNGSRVAFLSNADNPVVGMTGGTNADHNVEIFYTDLAAGNPTASANGIVGKQVTNTTRTNPSDTINILDVGRRMSRDGRYIAFDSYADLANGAANQTSFALYLYDTTTGTFRQIGPRSNEDAAASGGDISHYPGFTDTDASGTPQTLVFETRLNIKSDGTVAANASDGLNQDATRPTQIYSVPINGSTPTFTRLTKFPAPATLLASTQPIPSNSLSRMTFTLALTELGTGNSDLLNEAFYFLLPAVTTTVTDATLNFSTGASHLTVSPSPVPTPSPSPSPTPQTPPAVQGVSPGMLAIVDYGSASNPPVVPQTAVGSLSRSFTLPIQLSGVTVTINGAACGIKSVTQTQIVFVVPPAISLGTSNATFYPVVINNNGTVFRGSITIVPARPDIFTFSPVAAPLGRARIFNATNRVQTREPFTVMTLRYRGGVRVASVLRLYLTGVANLPNTAISIRVGSVTIPAANILTGAVLSEPGVYTVDFTVPSQLMGVGDVPIIVTVTVNGVTYQSRLDDTAPRTSFL